MASSWTCSCTTRYVIIVQGDDVIITSSSSLSQAKAIAQPFAYEEYRKERIKKKIEEARANRVKQKVSHLIIIRR